MIPKSLIVAALFLSLTYPVYAGVPMAAVVDNVVVVDTSDAPNGRYVFVVDVANGAATLRQITTVVRINPTGTTPDPDPGTPPDPDPDPPTGLAAQVQKWIDSVTDPQKQATAKGLANFYRGIGVMVSTGIIKTADKARQGAASVPAAYLDGIGKTAAWQPFVDAVNTELSGKNLEDVGTSLATIADVLKNQ